MLWDFGLEPSLCENIARGELMNYTAVNHQEV